ncbi:MAG: DPP IV N-terminal domain-containing protein [Bacteroidales bacterium]|nr:DPP IV N-terminal domain-containing protein [Bacteroidales bacterium]
MRKMLLAALAATLLAAGLGAQEWNRVPMTWKWISGGEVAFSYDGSFTDPGAFALAAARRTVRPGVKAPGKFPQMPLQPDGAVNLTFSPDSTKLAFTRDNDLWVADIATGAETRLTFDGTDLILNGYASWVYYEEILGRPSRYRAFWWSPDSKKIGFYRFDNSRVPMFPIYSPVGQDGSLQLTRYPKAGEPNPEVRIGIIDLGNPSRIVWADFDEHEDQYFGIPFWGPDSAEFFIAREPRRQDTLDLYSVSVADGSKKHIYHETYPTWLDWIEEVVFTDKGLYMARSFETGWEQIYFLSYDGKTFRRLTDGENWRVSLVRVDEKAGDVYFTANRDSNVRAALYKVDRKGRITALTDPALNVSGVRFSPDGKYFVASLSNYATPTQVWLFETARVTRNPYKVADLRGPDFDASRYALPQLVELEIADGFRVPASITYPVGFDPAKKYPVVMEIYGGPNTAYVREAWSQPSEANQWYSRNGIIKMTADVSASGHNGRAGTDLVFRDLQTQPIREFVEWARWLQSLPYVQGDKIGVTGFSFGGANTARLLLQHSDAFHYGIAGGGVYDWQLYDSHYTERFMDTPAANPDGYRASRVLDDVVDYPAEYGSDGSVMLKLTHGTGDDNVHFQNTLQLIDALQKAGKKFELMIYPDGLHGYRGYQGVHSSAADRAFWLKYLKNE